MSQEEFRSLIAEVVGAVAGKPLDDALARELNRRFPPDGDTFRAIDAACHAAIAEGWMCNREHGGVSFGRVIGHGPETAGFSVDVVRMKDAEGAYHRHPYGEIDMIMPVTPTARFDEHGAGWCVYAPDTAHYPTVTEGEALVLYLLPEGAIEFINPD